MNKNDFKKDEIVYLKYIGDKRHGTIGSITEATVKSVGSKYITTINGDFNTERKFEIDNDYREIYTIGGSDYQLYLNRQQIEEENEAIEITKLIHSQFDTWFNKSILSIEKLRKIKAIIEE